MHWVRAPTTRYLHFPLIASSVLLAPDSRQTDTLPHSFNASYNLWRVAYWMKMYLGADLTGTLVDHGRGTSNSMH